MKKIVLFVLFVIIGGAILSACGGTCTGSDGVQYVCAQSAPTQEMGLINIATNAVASPMSDPLYVTPTFYHTITPVANTPEGFDMPTPQSTPAGFSAVTPQNPYLLEERTGDVRVVDEDVDQIPGMMRIQITDEEGKVFEFICPDSCDLQTVVDNSGPITDGAKWVVPGMFSFDRSYVEVTTSQGVTYDVKYIDIQEVAHNVEEVQLKNGGLVAYFKKNREGTVLGGIEMRKLDLTWAKNVAIGGNAVADNIANQLSVSGFDTRAMDLRVGLFGSVASGYADFGSDVDMVLTYKVEPGQPSRVFEFMGALTSRAREITTPLAGSGLSDVNILVFYVIGFETQDPMYISLPIP